MVSWYGSSVQSKGALQGSKEIILSIDLVKRFGRQTWWRPIDVTSSGLIVSVCVFTLYLPGCAPTQPAAQQRALLIGRLEAARDLDFGNVGDGNTETAQADDSIYQATKAQRVIGKLQQGEEVPQPEIDDALYVPPESLPREARTEMLKELRTAETRDELGEQTHDPGNDWLAWDSYREQRDLTDEISKTLEAVGRALVSVPGGLTGTGVEIDARLISLKNRS